MKTVVIVDPYSSGQYLAGELYSLGFSTICIKIGVNIPAVYAASYNKDNFIKELSISFYFSKGLTIDLNTHMTAFMTIAILGNVVPLFMLQKGIALISPVKVSYILLLTPLFVFAFQIFDSRLALSIYSLIAIISVVVISFIGLKIEKKQEEKMKQQLQQEE
ncbi:hypothetical protein [Photorhabdus viridis]|uniref:hypothetical protein n=1 Tax=Photorhabdus viridis TaxID=3163327 RepID=UPI003306EE97